MARSSRSEQAISGLPPAAATAAMRKRRARIDIDPPTRLIRIKSRRLEAIARVETDCRMFVRLSGLAVSSRAV